MICFAFMAHYGMGKHYWLTDSNKLLLTSFIQSQIGLIPGLFLVKLSVGLSLLRFRSRQYYYTYVVYGLLVFIVFSWLFGTFTIIFFCNPVSRYWDPDVKGTCYPIQRFINFGVAHTSFNIFTDIAFATVPVPLVWSLQMNLRTRAYVIAIFSLGYVAVAFGIVRAVYQIGFGGSPDSTFLESVQFWGSIQVNIGIIAACAPTLKPLFSRVLHLSSYATSNKYGASGGSAIINRSNRRRTGYIEQRTPTTTNYELENVYDKNDSDPKNLGLITQVGIARTVDDAERGNKQHEGSLYERSGSEETILHPQSPDKGIMRTTEVTIER